MSGRKPKVLAVSRILDGIQMPLSTIGANTTALQEFLPTKQTFRRIAKGINLEQSDKAVEQIFDTVVLSGT